MITYANIPLLREDADGILARWLGQHLSLEDLRLFGAETTPLAGQRNNSQGGNSHVISLPTPNYPAAPRLRINSLYWPTGAARFSWFLGLVSDSQLQQIRQKVIGTDRKMSPAQLVLGDSSHDVGVTIPANGYSTGPNNRPVLSTEMWMLAPRCLGGRDPYSPSTASPVPYERVWLVPFVDERYFWQTKATPSYLYGNFYVTETSVPDADATPPTTVREWRIEFVGQYSRMAMPANAVAINDVSLDPASVTTSAVQAVAGSLSSRTNEAWRVLIDGATRGTFTLSITIPSSMATMTGIGAVTQTTAPLAWDATPEEIESALHDLLLGRVRWTSLIENVETAIDKRIEYTSPEISEWGWPDRVELDRRFESLGLVFDAIAHSTGCRFVRDIDGEVSLISAFESNFEFESQTAQATGIAWRQIAGRETLDDGGWSKNGSFREGQFVPESIDVVFRDLTRSTRVGSWRPLDNSLPTNTWRTDGGRLVINVPIETADTDQFSSLVDSTGSLNQWSLKVPGWTETIHTPSLNNTGTVNSLGDDYSDLAGTLASNWYDWRRRLFDLRYAGVMPWNMTGFDDHVEFSIGERIGDPTKDAHGNEDGYGGFIASTRIQSMPMNFGCSDSLNQIGTLCGWTEDMIQGEVREAIGVAVHPRLFPDKARAWIWLPPMELQGEDTNRLSTHRRSATITTRSIDASALPGTYFQAIQFFGENLVQWLDCTRYCGQVEWIWNAPSLPGGWSADPLTQCGAACESSPPTEDGEFDGSVQSTYCVDDGSMQL